MSTIEIIPPQFDIDGFYRHNIMRVLKTDNSKDERVIQLKALVSQAFQQGRYDARILNKDNSKWVKD